MNRAGFVKGTNIVKNIQKRKEAEAALLKSEIFFRSVWQHSASGMRITDLDGIVINTNKAYCDMVGIPESELIGAPFSVIYAEEERSRIIQKHRERFAGGNIPPFMQKKLQLWNGNIIWVEVSNSFVEFGGGQTLLLGVFTDITHRKQSELALLESEERWQFALEGAGDGVWDWNCVTNEVLFSHNWKAMLGYSDDEISSNLDEWSKRIHQDDLKRVTEALNHCLNKETQYYQSEHRMLCKDGTYKWVLDRGKVIEWGENDTPLRMIGTHANISELKKSEQIIRDLQRRESIGVLAGGIAHDFNNLLTAIIGNVSLAQLRVGKEHASVHQNLERVMSAAERAATLSKQMLAYSGKGKFQIVEIDLVKMVQDSIGLFSASLPKNVSVVKHLSPVPVFVKGDPGQIEQVVMNLIINAGEAVGTKNGVVNISVVSMSMNEESLVPYGRLNNQHLERGRICAPAGDRYRRRNGCRDTPKDLRSILHDEIRGARTRAFRGARDHQRSQRRDHRLQRSEWRHDLPGRLADDHRGQEERGAATVFRHQLRSFQVDPGDRRRAIHHRYDERCAGPRSVPVSYRGRSGKRGEDLCGPLAVDRSGDPGLFHAENEREGSAG
jgi:PAS domain S-box-containing protein